MEYQLPRGYLSASAINTLLKCPRQYEFRYVQGLTKPANKSLALGSVTHEAFETYYNDVLENNERFTGSQLAELTLDSIIPDWIEDNETSLTTTDVNDINRVVPDIVENYADKVGAHITPVSTEQEVLFTLECGVPMKAYIDLVRVRGEDGRGIVDYKTSSKSWTLSRLQNSLQFMLYSYATGIPDVQIQNIVVPNKGKKVSFDNTFSIYDPANTTGSYSYDVGVNFHVFGNTFAASQKTYLESLVESCARLITSGIFTPCGPDNWWCTPAWCDYWPICRGAK